MIGALQSFLRTQLLTFICEFQEYMAFMISKETENVQSTEEIVDAFRAITKQEREYVTKEELYHNLTREMADYCMKKMKPYVGQVKPGLLKVRFALC